MEEKHFTQSILNWYDGGHRDLPWRRTDDPYAIWVSEIMLQQTRAETVVSYYQRFLAHYPTVQALAEAPEEALLKDWEGLGYYSRARSLQKAARQMMEMYGGKVPDEIDELRALPGIGDYTAGAIASIAFQRPEAAVDGNVERVICRHEAIKDVVGTPAVRRRITEHVKKLVPLDRPGAFTNAMIEMGAVMCTPKNPSCMTCPVRASCKGLADGVATELPHKAKKKPPRVENLAMLMVFCGERVLVIRREEKMLGGLFVFPYLTEVKTPENMENELKTMRILAAYDEYSGHARHVFTHRIWEMDIYIWEAESCTPVPQGQWVTREELEALPMPTAVKVARDSAMARLMKRSR